MAINGTLFTAKKKKTPITIKYEDKFRLMPLPTIAFICTLTQFLIEMQALGRMQDRFFEQGVSFLKVKPVARSQDNDQSIISIADVIGAQPLTPAESNISDHNDAADKTGSTKSGNNDDHDSNMSAFDCMHDSSLPKSEASVFNHTHDSSPHACSPKPQAKIGSSCEPTKAAKAKAKVKEIANESGESKESSTDDIEETTACNDLDKEASGEHHKSRRARKISGNGAAGAKERVVVTGRTRSAEQVSPRKHAGAGGGEQWVPPRKKQQLGEDDELFMEGSSKDTKHRK
ncbi:hypothetical protein FRC06_007963 [Ceratobasidium sp. 370]|nr:hypothetical protein FRC06_007963 [Ceratobasidium sp. 370]